MTYLCPHCFNNSILGRRIEEVRRTQNYPKCSFHTNRKGVPISKVAELLDAVIRANYSIAVEAFGYIPGSRLTDLIRDLTQAANEEVVYALSDTLIDGDRVDPRDGDFPFYGDDQNYERIELDGSVQSRLWQQFRFSIIHGRRFFNDDAKRLLAEIFDKIQYQSDDRTQSAFYAIEDSRVIYRARGVRSLVDVKKLANDVARELGPPPQQLRKAGRMNAAGIGAFYGALDEPTCLAELRPPVGSLVCVATFRFTRPIYVLDFTRFERPGKHVNLFSKNHASRTTQWAFMQSFQLEISKPILPDDEHLEYVPAQVVAEYLTSTPMLWRGADRKIDGFVFRSAQRPGGRNLVLFGDAGLVVGGHVSGAGPEGRDFALDDIPSLPSMPAARPALEYVEDSFGVRAIKSADFGCEEVDLVTAFDLDI